MIDSAVTNKSYKDRLMEAFSEESEWDFIKGRILESLFFLFCEHLIWSLDDKYDTPERRARIRSLHREVKHYFYTYYEFFDEIEDRIHLVYKISRGEVIDCMGLEESDLADEMYSTLDEMLNLSKLP